MFNQHKSRLGNVPSKRKGSGFSVNMKSTSSGLRSQKPITQVALEGDFTFSGIEEDSRESRSTSLLPSINITHVSPSRRHRTTSDSLNGDQGVTEKMSEESEARLVKKSHSQSNISSMLPSSSSEQDQQYKTADTSNEQMKERHRQSLVENTTTTAKTSSAFGSFKKRCSRSMKLNRSGNNGSQKRQLSWKKDPLTETVSSKTLFFSGEDEVRNCVKGVVIPRLRDNFLDKNLESAYKKYSHRQRQKSLVILNVIDIALKVAFFFDLLIRIKETQGRIRIPITELLLLIPWIVLNSVIIGLITCWKKCANHFLDYAALFSWILFTIETYLVFASLFGKISGADDTLLVSTPTSSHFGMKIQAWQININHSFLHYSLVFHSLVHNVDYVWNVLDDASPIGFLCCLWKYYMLNRPHLDIHDCSRHRPDFLEEGMYYTAYSEYLLPCWFGAVVTQKCRLQCCLVDWHDSLVQIDPVFWV